jgi:hypothetical protein
MVAAAERLAWCEEFIRTKEGHPFSVEGRDWVRTELFEAADGWKLWPNDPDRLCEACRGQAGSITEWSRPLEQKLARHARTKSGCAGLRAEPVQLVVINLPRREGKTLNVAGYNLSALYKEQRRYITYVASAGRQTRTLFEENYAIPIRQQRTLAKHAIIRGESIKVPRTGSKLEVVETSHASITGRGRTHIVIDEARDIPERVIAALLPSMRDQNGLDCPTGLMGHTRARPGPSAPRTCSVCKADLIPWYGRIIIISSSGLLESDARDWFYQLVEKLTAEPHPNAHLYRSDQATNPAIAESSTRMIEEIFGDLPAMKDSISVEMSNVARRKGEDFVGKRELDAVIDPHAENLEGTPAPCVAFLDTSISTDTTSLVFVADDEIGESVATWDRIFVARVDLWEPKKLPRGVIDPAVIASHLDRVVPLFPRLVALEVDVRAMPWARDLVVDLNRARKGWGKKVVAFHGGGPERDLAWAVLEQRILSRKIRLLALPRLRDELLGVRRVSRLDGTTEIRDRSRKKRHADIAESLAACCYRIYVEQTRPRRTGLLRANQIQERPGRRVTAALYGLTEDSL